MADFGKLNFSTSFNPTSAFPLDARCYFTDLPSAEEAASQAEEVGSTNTIYHYGMKLLVDDGDSSTWYTIRRDGTLSPDISESRLNEFAMLTDEEIEKLTDLLMDGAPVCEPYIEINHAGRTYVNSDGEFMYYRSEVNVTITNISKGLIQKLEIGRVIVAEDRSDYQIEWYNANITFGDDAHTSVNKFTFTNPDDKGWGGDGWFVRFTYYDLLGDTKVLSGKTVNAPK